MKVLRVVQVFHVNSWSANSPMMQILAPVPIRNSAKYYLHMEETPPESIWKESLSFIH